MERIADIAAAVEEELKGGVLAGFSDRRKALNGGRRSPGGMFNQHKEDEVPLGGYAFPLGGRSELQFNIGFEEEGTSFRFGVAFAFQPGRYLTEPVRILGPKVERFNAVIDRYDLADLKMWHYVDHVLQPQRVPGPVSSVLMRNGVFVFLGLRVPVGPGGLTQDQVRAGARVLERLWPLYAEVEGDAQLNTVSRDVRVARLAWNTQGWQQPSGRAGKAKGARNFEAVSGYAHEEWLFDFSVLRDGWKYGFIRAYGGRHVHVGKTFDLLLYSIDGRSGQRYWVGLIEGIEALDKMSSGQATRWLEKNGKLGAMRREVEALELVPETLVAVGNHDVVNARFRPSYATRFDPVPIPPGVIAVDRYSILQHVPDSQHAMLLPGRHRRQLTERNIKVMKTTRTNEGGISVVQLRQAEWQQQLRVTLPEDLPGARIEVETDDDAQRVDARIQWKGITAFVELKSQGSPKQVIRQALSQLLEYAYWPKASRCDALVIVGPSPAGGDEIGYLAMLRTDFLIPVHYLHFEDRRIVGIADFWERLSAGAGDRT